MQPGPNPPQFGALRPDTDLVTITIGGNDINIGGLWLSCAQLSPTDPSGDPCKRRATAGGTDLYAQRIAAAAPKVAQALEGIRQRAPRATVLLVSYLRILPHNGVLSSGVRWVEGTTPTSAAAPDHPNLTGMREVAGFALDALQTAPASHR